MHNSYPVAGSHQVPLSTFNTVRSVNYGTGLNNSLPVQGYQQSPLNTTIASDSIKTDFGKIKGIEILHFRAAQLEKSFGGQSAFASMGPLQVIYFPQYDRFVLSLNSWKYPLLKRVPVVGSSASQGLPVTYTLPTVNGFFTLIISKVEHTDSILNLETIFQECTSFTTVDSHEVTAHSGNILPGHSSVFGQQTQSTYVQVPGSFPLNGNMMQGGVSPRYSSHIGQSFNNTFQTVPTEPLMAEPKKKSRWSRIFRKSDYGKDNGDRIGSSRHNLNLVQKRDIESMKRTTEVMAAAHYYPRIEIERWIIYNKEMANIMNFSPELGDQDFTPFGHSILNRSNMENIDHTLPCQQPITSERPNVIYEVGQNFTSATRHDGKVKHGYIQGHSHSIHPDVASRYNNLSNSEFHGERFRNMTNTSGLYEASGISPINQIDQPYTFNQEDNILTEEIKPTFTERVSETVTGHHTTGQTQHFTQPEHSTISFADRVKELTGGQQSQTLGTSTLSNPIVQTTQTLGTSTLTNPIVQTTQTLGTSPLSNPIVQTTGSNVLRTEIGQPRVIESGLVNNPVLRELQPTTENVSEGTRASALPTLQERIRNVGTVLNQKTRGIGSNEITNEPTHI